MLRGIFLPYGFGFFFYSSKEVFREVLEIVIQVPSHFASSGLEFNSANQIRGGFVLQFNIRREDLENHGFQMLSVSRSHGILVQNILYAACGASVS